MSRSLGSAQEVVMTRSRELIDSESMSRDATLDEPPSYETVLSGLSQYFKASADFASLTPAIEIQS